jgi:hypothetical protein
MYNIQVGLVWCFYHQLRAYLEATQKNITVVFFDGKNKSRKILPPSQFIIFLTFSILTLTTRLIQKSVKKIKLIAVLFIIKYTLHMT